MCKATKLLTYCMLLNKKTLIEIYTYNTELRSKYHSRGPFLERPSKLMGPVSYFEIEVSRKVECVLTSNEVHFVSLAENFTV